MTPEPTPPRPERRGRGCAIAIAVSIIAILLAGAVLYAQRIDLAAWTMRRGFARQPWSEATRTRAEELLQRTVQAYRDGRISAAEEAGADPILQGFHRAMEDGEVTDEEAGPILDRWEGWLEAVAG